MLKRIGASLNRRLKAPRLNRHFNQYRMSIKHGILENSQMKAVHDMSADPYEPLSHYDAYAYFVQKNLTEKGGPNLRILDLGSMKYLNAINSILHTVTAIVLKPPSDGISNVDWVVHDVASKEKLPFQDNSFDVFTSCVSLFLIGLGRYGDSLNGNAIPEFMNELDRVLTPNAEILVSVQVGKDYLHFNAGWIFSIESWKELFGKKWKLDSFVFDLESTPSNTDAKERFTSQLPDLLTGECKVAHLKFSRVTSSK